jgi:hypothetical protein
MHGVKICLYSTWPKVCGNVSYSSNLTLIWAKSIFLVILSEAREIGKGTCGVILKIIALNPSSRA